VLAALWLALLSTTPARPPAAAVEMRRVSVYGGHASLEVPADWREMPPELLEFLALRAADQSGGRSTEIYQHGFRPGNLDTGFDLPQVLIQIREDGRLPLSRFFNLPTPDEVEAGSRGLMSEGGGPFLRDLDLDRVAFDPDRVLLRVDSTMELLVEGTTAVRSASFLTERGAFVVHCYERAARMDASGPLFDRVIASVRFDDEVGYRPRWSDRWTGRHSVLLLLALAAGAALVVAAAWRDRRRRQAETAARALE
jgi:hypothetical protein